jgi:hypothetical protein
MTKIQRIKDAYVLQVKRPWQSGVSGSERVWMLVYEPSQERQVRAILPDLKLATVQAGHKWDEFDITDTFNCWIADHEHAEAFYGLPSDLTEHYLDEFQGFLVDRLKQQLSSQDGNTIVALIGLGSLFPYRRASAVIKRIDDDVPGRMLTLFPGSHDAVTNNFHLLNARDGFNYRALVIDPTKDAK